MPPLSEYAEQCLVAAYLDMLIMRGKVVKYTAVPNGTWTPSMAQKMKNRKMGLNPGFPDLFVIFPKAIVCIEMKREDGGVTSSEQWGWIEALGTHGIAARVAFGYKGAKEIIDSYL